MFEDIHEIAEDNAYLKAVEEKDVSLDMLQELPTYEELKDMEHKLKEEQKITFEHIFHEPTGFYMIKCFLIADYAGDKAIFIKDVEAYKSMRFESARRKVATLIYRRFVSEEGETAFPKASSVFDIIRQEKPDEKKADAVPPPPSSAPAPATNGDGGAGGADGANGTTSNRAFTEVTEEALRQNKSLLQIGDTNAIGVYGKAVKTLKDRIEAGDAPKELFDEVSEEVMNDLKHDVFPRFLKSSFYRKYIRTKWIETKPVSVKDFATFRVLGRGGFGAVHATRKNNCGMLYAMKVINKKLVKMKSALTNIMEERDVLTMLKSTFVTNLKYALQDENNLYLVMDLMSGGDLKFHLINDGKFTEERARFYAAEVLLGLEHIHSLNIIYRDMKLENVLLDDKGHCRISDLGLAVITKSKIKGYAGTPGYTAPEMIKNKPYGPSADLFSFGVMLYRMLCGAKPFKGKVDRDLDKAVVEKEPKFPPDIFSPESTSLLTGLLQKRPEKRLGAGPRGMEEIKEHPFFASIDWGLLEAGYLDPPWVPPKEIIHAASPKDIGDFDVNKFKNVRLNERFKKTVKRFDYISSRALQEEMVSVLQKADANVNFEKFAAVKSDTASTKKKADPDKCCVML